MTRRGMYALAGAGLSLGAPAGLLLFRGVLAGSPARAVDALPADLPTYLYVLLSTAVVFSVFGHTLGQQADRLLALSTSDPVTGLKNRRFMNERLQDELERARRYGTALALLMIDVDRLKEINDDTGHVSGDRALLRVAEAIRTNARATDVAARWGGDEFVVLAPNTDAQAAVALAERIRARLSHGEETPRVTVSTGISNVTDGRVPYEIDALVGAADAALYAAKRGGRDRIVTSSSTARGRATPSLEPSSAGD
jgi:two-component system cell cycle response regulator